MRPILAVGAVLALALAAPQAKAATGGQMSAPVVYFDIAGPDVKALADFYDAVFGWRTTSGVPFPDAPYLQPLPVISPLPAGLRKADSPDDPQQRKIMYIGVEDVTAALAKVTAHGGSVVAPRFEVKGVAVLGLFKDPAGNVMGLVELAGGKPKIP
jgi:predicted enzyme related to lactoylglutathione lyase